MTGILPRTRWTTYATLVLLAAALLVGIQDLTGIFLHHDRPLNAAGFLEHEANAFRHPLHAGDLGIPERLRSSVTILEKGRALEEETSRQAMIKEPAGRYAWTTKNLWISPLSGSPQDLVARLPVLMTWRLRLPAYGLALLGLLAVVRSRSERELWRRPCLAVRQWLVRGLYGDSPARPIAVAGTVLFAVAVLVLNSGIGKPVWIDEFLHFCFAGYDSTGEAWRAVHESVVKVNHGQTGVYMMLDYWLLKVFGASALALRLPSLISAAFLLLSSGAVMRFRGFGLYWQFLVLLALFTPFGLLSFAAEARPYMPLTAATAGVLAYYLAPREMRGKRAVAVGGWAAVILGATMHPYFGIYWFSVFVFAHLLALAEGTLKPGVRTLFWHVNLPMSLVGGVLFLGIGSLTWLRGGPAFELDPYRWVKRDGLRDVIVDYHLGLFDGHSARMTCLVIIAALPLIYLVLPKNFRSHLRPLIAPALLLCLAFGLTAAVSYLSYRRNYWILTRQWVASMAMVTVAMVWLWGELARQFARWHAWAGALVVLILPCLLAGPALTTTRARLKTIRMDLAAASAMTYVEPPKPEAPPANLSAETWVQLANQNIFQGGPVWPFFRRYYDTESNMNPVFENYHTK